jgi:hypothetical protein
MDALSRRIERLQEQQALGDLAAAYMGFFHETQDHREAFAETCKWAIKSGFEPAACWVHTGMLAKNHPTHSVAFRKGTSPLYLSAIIGGVSLLSRLDVMYAPHEGIHAGWKLIEGESLLKYHQWAEEDAKDAQQVSAQ